MTTRQMICKWTTECLKCGNPITKGSVFVWVGPKQTYHVRCDPRVKHQNLKREFES